MSKDNTIKEADYPILFNRNFKWVKSENKEKIPLRGYYRTNLTIEATGQVIEVEWSPDDPEWVGWSTKNPGLLHSGTDRIKDFEQRWDKEVITQKKQENGMRPKKSTRKKKMEWEVFVQKELLSETAYDSEDFEEMGGKDGIHTYEISLIRKGNEHGHESYGWDSAAGDKDDKIVLFDEDHNNLGETGYETVPKKQWEWALKTAQQFCDVLNKQLHLEERAALYNTVYLKDRGIVP